MKKIYHLSSCNTCAKIIKQLPSFDQFELQDIKTNKISAEQLLEMKKLSGSYESLFSRKARLYQSMNLKDKSLTEEDYKKLILDEYTFLKRPVIIFHQHIFIGNQKATIEKAISIIHKF